MILHSRKDSHSCYALSYLSMLGALAMDSKAHVSATSNLSSGSPPSLSQPISSKGKAPNVYACWTSSRAKAQALARNST